MLHIKNKTEKMLMSADTTAKDDGPHQAPDLDRVAPQFGRTTTAGGREDGERRPDIEKPGQGEGAEASEQDLRDRCRCAKEKRSE